MLTWSESLGKEKKAPYFQRILDFLVSERTVGKIIYPAQKEMFNAFRFTPLASVKVVILGQDPYHQPKQAHGLAFSVQPGIAIPPSLANIYRALKHDIADFIVPSHGYLASWAAQGVLLLNTVLTVEASLPGSHSHIGWQTFTDRVITLLNEHCEHLIFLLWGAHAQNKKKMIDQQRHTILTAPHPSPLSAHRGFLTCQHFAQTNRLLQQHGQLPINWQLPERVLF